LVWEFRKARFVRRLDAIVHQRARIADRDAYPFIAAVAIFDRTVDPAAVLLAEVVGDVADVNALLREKMRQRVEAPEQVRAGAGVSGDGSLRLHVFIRLA